MVAPATTTPMAQQLQATGTVQAIDSSIAHVRPLTRGRLQDVLVKVGDRVASNQVLAQIDSIEAGEIITQYNSAPAELQRLKIQSAAQQRQVERNRRLAEIGAVPQKEYEFSVAEQQGFQEGIRAQESTIAGLTARLRRFGITDPPADASPMTAIRAPFAGVIIRVAAAPGDVVESGAELFSVADLSAVYVQAQVYEKDLGQVHVGQAASISIDSYPGEHFTGRVASISDLIDPQTRTAAVRCQVANPRTRLRAYGKIQDDNAIDDLAAGFRVISGRNRTAGFRCGRLGAGTGALPVALMHTAPSVSESAAGCKRHR